MRWCPFSQSLRKPWEGIRGGPVLFPTISSNPGKVFLPNGMVRSRWCGNELEVKYMVKQSKTIARQIDRKRAMFFGLLILLIMLIVSSVSGYLSLTLQRDEENRFTRTIE